MTQSSDLETRIRRLEDRREIDDLVLLYFLAMDERDLPGLPYIFAEDAHLGSADGVFAANGLAEIESTYEGRFAVLGPTFHFSHGVIVGFDDDPDLAHGVVAGHAEVVRNGTTMWVALRYEDVYRRTPQGWRIADRVMSYMYYAPAESYAAVMKQDNRNLCYGDERPADWPSALTGGSLDWLRRFYR
ncbi:nuclear transport factor 2 family protein [Streptomyces carpinensis]|uniref:Nuclear transport factor 2 family protein n=1 Tax=Streptomyces carpinensis TaxID=66369 RepID=A0ABV1VZM3_9ACTN|nr:nuclear transport factor 2 family protein [Streptomyces carpinensis]